MEQCSFKVTELMWFWGKYACCDLGPYEGLAHIVAKKGKEKKNKEKLALG